MLLVLIGFCCASNIIFNFVLCSKMRVRYYKAFIYLLNVMLPMRGQKFSNMNTSNLINKTTQHTYRDIHVQYTQKHYKYIHT